MQKCSMPSKSVYMHVRCVGAAGGAGNGCQPRHGETAAKIASGAVKIRGSEPIAATQCLASPWNVNTEATATTAMGSGAAMKRMRS